VIRTIDCDYLGPDVAAAYLRVDGDEVAFIETNTSHAVPKLLTALAEAGRRPEQVRWVIVTHAHLDHAGGASALMAACPQATLLCHPRAARNLIDPSKLIASAQHVYGAQRFAELYGTIAPIPAERVRALDDGEHVPLGTSTLSFLHTAGHAKHHFVVHDQAQDVVFTGDAFGLTYPRLQRAKRFAFPSTSPIDFDAAEAHRAVDRIVALEPRAVFPTHFGEWREVEAIAAQVHQWVDFSQAAIDDCVARGQRDCEAGLRRALEQEMVRTAAVAGLSLDQQDLGLLELDLQLNAQGLAFVVGRRLTS
jgi:glyoxylase-like metal-dependent hydrolase (beta-lactamase superfamily II)